MSYVIHTRCGRPFESLTVSTELGKEIVSWMERGEMKYLDFTVDWADGEGHDHYIVRIDEVAGVTNSVRTHFAHETPLRRSTD